MCILAFDACLGAVSVAVGTLDAGGNWVTRAAAFEARTAGHAERLMPMVADTMHRAGFSFSDIARLAVTVGPGGFTGVRVTIAAARALALATGCALVGVTTLEALAEEARARLGGTLRGRDLAVAVDARRDMVFVQRFPSGSGADAGPQLLARDQAAALIGGGAPAIMVGSAASDVAQLVIQNGGSAEAMLTDLQPHATAVGRLGASRAPVHPLRPLYLRAPDAKPQASPVLPRVPS